VPQIDRAEDDNFVAARASAWVTSDRRTHRLAPAATAMFATGCSVPFGDHKPHA